LASWGFVFVVGVITGFTACGYSLIVIGGDALVNGLQGLVVHFAHGLVVVVKLFFGQFPFGVPVAVAAVALGFFEVGFDGLLAVFAPVTKDTEKSLNRVPLLPSIFSPVPLGSQGAG